MKPSWRFWCLGAINDPNFVTFVLFVVISFLTTKDAKHTKAETEEERRIYEKAGYKGKQALGRNPALLIID